MRPFAEITIFGIEIESTPELLGLMGLVAGAVLLLWAAHEPARKLRYLQAILALTAFASVAIAHAPKGEVAQGAFGSAVAGHGSSGACFEERAQPPDAFMPTRPSLPRFIEPSGHVSSGYLQSVAVHGHIAVRYNRHLPAAQIRALKRFVREPASRGRVHAFPRTWRYTTYKARVATRKLECEVHDLTRLRAFRDDWFAFLDRQRDVDALIAHWQTWRDIPPARFSIAVLGLGASLLFLAALTFLPPLARRFGFEPQLSVVNRRVIETAGLGKWLLGWAAVIAALPLVVMGAGWMLLWSWPARMLLIGALLTIAGWYLWSRRRMSPPTIHS